VSRKRAKTSREGLALTAITAFFALVAEGREKENLLDRDYGEKER